MKILISVVALSVLVTACDSQKDDKLRTSTDSLSYYMGVYTALKLKAAGYKKFDHVKFDYALKSAFKSKDAREIKTADSINSAYFKKAKAHEFAQTLAEGNKFLAENKKRPSVHLTASGLQYEIFVTGQGRKPLLNDSVVMHYTAKTTEGLEFINTYKTNSPLKILLRDGTRAGLEALQMMNEGSHYRFYIPAELAYGEKSDPAGIIKPFSSLIYNIELISVISSKRD
jgi:FKBP-type peptidyl-prolyl cis-trans isomerase